MSRRRKVHPLRLVLIILIVIALCFVGFFAVKLYLNNKPVKEETTTNTEITPSSNEETKISIEDYTVYIDDDEELDFNFIIAKLKFVTSNDTLYYDLANLTNSERNSKISDVDYYVEKLESLHYDISAIELAKEIKSDSNSTVANILIPFTSKTGVLNVYNGEKLTFDLTRNNVNASTLKPYNSPDQTVIKTNDYEVMITENPYLSTMMTHNGDEYDASGVSVYTFKIVVNNVKDNVCIEEAEFIKEGSAEAITALNEEYQSLKVDNIIKMPLKKGSTGALFFELYKNYDAAINYNGVLRIKFSDSNDKVEISTTIK